jgi:hypothetical protein
MWKYLFRSKYALAAENKLLRNLNSNLQDVLRDMTIMRDEAWGAILNFQKQLQDVKEEK